MAKRMSDMAKDWSWTESIDLRLKEMKQLQNQYFLGTDISKSSFRPTKIEKLDILDTEDGNLCIYYKRGSDSPILISINEDMTFDMMKFMDILVSRMNPEEAMFFILKLINRICEKYKTALKGEVSMLGAISDSLQEKQLIIMQEAIISRLQNEGV